jgi:hypothetical protein
LTDLKKIKEKIGKKRTYDDNGLTESEIGKSTTRVEPRKQRK